MGLTNLDREAGRQAQGNEVPELGEKRIANSHEVDDGSYLLTQGQGMLLTKPQLGLEPAPPGSQGVRDIVGVMLPEPSGGPAPPPRPSCPAHPSRAPAGTSLLCLGGQFHGAAHVTVAKLKVGVEVLFCGDGSGVGSAQSLGDQGLHRMGRGHEPCSASDARPAMCMTGPEPSPLPLWGRHGLGPRGKEVLAGMISRTPSRPSPEPHPYLPTKGHPWPTLTPFWGPPCCSAIPRKDCSGVLQPVRNAASWRTLQPSEVTAPKSEAGGWFLGAGQLLIHTNIQAPAPEGAETRGAGPGPLLA